MNEAKEISAGAIIFFLESLKPLTIKYLLLFRKAKNSFKDYWGFVQGNVEAKENLIDTVKREAKEESNLEIEILPKFKEKIYYFYKRANRLISKEVIFFVARARTKEVKISKEHDSYAWLKFEEALERLRFKNQKELLEKANKFIQEFYRQRPLF